MKEDSFAEGPVLRAIVSIMDIIMYDAQRQGRLSFYMVREPSQPKRVYGSKPLPGFGR